MRRTLLLAYVNLLLPCRMVQSFLAPRHQQSHPGRLYAHHTNVVRRFVRFSNQTSSSWLQTEDQHNTGPPQMLQRTQQPPKPAASFESSTSVSFPSTTCTVVLDNNTNTAEQQQQHIRNARWLLLLAAALYGTNFACVKLLLGGNEAMSMGMSSTLRFGLAALATSPWLLSTQQEDDDDAIPSFLAGFEVGLWTSIGYIAQAVGLETTLASESAFLCSLAVVIVPLLDWSTGKALRSREVVGAVLALIGVGCLELSDSIGTGVGFALSRGDVISMIQPFAFGVGFWRMEAAMRKYPNQANRSTAAQLLAVFLASGAYTLATEGGTMDISLTSNAMGTILHDPSLWAGLLWTGCVTTALSVYMETVALQTLSAAETTLILSTEPLWGSITAAVLLGESFGPVAVAGGALVILACVWSNLGAEGLLAFFASAADDVGSSTSQDVDVASLPPSAPTIQSPKTSTTLRP